MSNLYRVLREKFSILKRDYPDAILEDIVSSDIVYTDGLAAEAKFKIVFSIYGKYITTIFIKDDGSWFSTVGSATVKKAIRDWIQSVTIELPSLEVPVLE